MGQRQNNIRTHSKVEFLTLQVQQLKESLLKFEHSKNSKNSSIPPSKDENRPKHTQSLREKSGKKPGGQKGHTGNTLKIVETPDLIIKHLPDYFSFCGRNIKNHPSEFSGKRQQIDIPEIKFTVTEHQQYKTVCDCGHITKSSYPSNVVAPICYGSDIESLIGYFNTRQYIPFKRLQEIFNDIFQVPISEGGIHYLLNKLVKKALPAYNLIKQKLQSDKSGAIGADETGMKINGDKNWAWTWQNHETTFITISDNRGGNTKTIYKLVQ